MRKHKYKFISPIKCDESGDGQIFKLVAPKLLRESKNYDILR